MKKTIAKILSAALCATLSTSALTAAESKDIVYGNAGEVSEYSTENSNYSLNIDGSNQVHDISDMLYGIFFEDINFAADGGLYAEMVRNRSFEFTQLAQNNQKHGWNNVGKVTAKVTIDDKKNGLNENNKNYMVINNKTTKKCGIANKGFLDGMSVQKNAKYNFSIYAKGLSGYKGKVFVELVNGNKTIASGTIKKVTSKWKKYNLTLTSNETASNDVKLQIKIKKGKLAVDMVSLFPQDTYKQRSNGLRKDLAEKLEALNPKFLRFPGGCVAEGINMDAAYNWKDSIGVDSKGEPILYNGKYGDVAVRKQGQNIWTNERTTTDINPSFMTYGLGFYEYFQLAEDIGAIGVPVINCGMCCMIQSNGAGYAVGTKEFEQCIQDALDLVEFCRGDATTKWGKVRISMGHTEPFTLKYIGIGNEQWGSRFFERYEAFVDAFDKAKKENPNMYGDIELMFSSGADDGDSDTINYPASYREAANWLNKHPDKTINDFAGAIDHHYYNSPTWFLNHTDYYDEKNYSRDVKNMTDTKYGGGINVFLGEYAAQSNTLKAALAEAAYMTGLERNGDIVKMAAYAPLFGNLTAMHWAPDLIWFNNHTSTCSVNYYVQQIFAKNAGLKLIQSELIGANIKPKPLTGKAGVGTWSTSATFDNIKVTDNDTGKVLSEQDFTNDTFSSDWQKISDGSWSVKDGTLVQSSTSTNTNTYSTTGTAAYFGDTSWKNYTYTLDAVKTGGSEGFLIPIAVGDKNNNFFWNIGGWNNTLSCLQQVSDGIKSDQLSGTVKNFKIVNGQTYHLKAIVTDYNIKCYIDDTLYIDYDIPETTNAEAYHVVSTDDTGDIIIKLVNETGENKTFAIDLKNTNIANNTASRDVVGGTSLNNDNILGKPEVVTLKSDTVSGIKNNFNYTVPQYSVTVLRIKTK